MEVEAGVVVSRSAVGLAVVAAVVVVTLSVRWTPGGSQERLVCAFVVLSVDRERHCRDQ